MEPATLAERSAHGAREHPTADYARLSQRHPYWPFNREHGIERPRHAGRRLHYPREKTGALLEKIQQRADAKHAAADLDRHRHALGQSVGLPRQPWLHSPALRFLATTF